ncbi:hypothetical protein H312_01464 [Anncaliia algerae PRA339]|uniref:ISXO2-like transposase domain-containing protein n=1 Tax=Anncaliia algerae PRA339 TaxID=1288291 RepID=A0A059F1G1_9MICR|nr:hypothetical protein H312_01464 [Anncaliia algerae PRA339]
MHTVDGVTKRNEVSDGYSLNCRTSHCKFYNNLILICRGSFFNKYKLPLADIFSVLFCWSQNKQVQTVVDDLKINKKTVIKIYANLRNLVANHIDEERILLGGPGIVCQIDESCFSHRVKSHMGRAPQDPIWVFGIVDTS